MLIIRSDDEHLEEDDDEDDHDDYDGVDDHERGSHDVTLSHSDFDHDDEEEEDGEEDDEIMKTTILHFSKFQLWI